MRCGVQSFLMPSSLKLRGSNGRKYRILLQWEPYQLVKRDTVIGRKRIEYDRVVWNGLVLSERRTAYVVLRRLPYNAAAFIVKKTLRYHHLFSFGSNRSESSVRIIIHDREYSRIFHKFTRAYSAMTLQSDTNLKVNLFVLHSIPRRREWRSLCPCVMDHFKVDTDPLYRSILE